VSRHEESDTLSWASTLRSIPVRNIAARVQGDPESGVTILIKRQRPRWFVPPVSWIVPFRAERKITLDRIGSRVWGLCDGSRTVETIIDTFAQWYGLSFHEARAAVTGYLKSLVQRGVLAIGIAKES